MRQDAIRQGEFRPHELKNIDNLPQIVALFDPSYQR